MSLSGSVALPLMSDIFWYAATAAFSLVSTLFLKSAGSFLIPVRKASAASVYSMYSCGTRAKFLLVICRLKSLDTCTSSLSAVLTSSGDFNCCAEAGTARVRRSPTDAIAASVSVMRFISSPFCIRYAQYAVHAFPVSGSRAEEWIVARRRRRELNHHGRALVAHRCCRNDARIVFGNDAFVLVDILVHRFHLTRMHEHPVVAGAQELSAV